MVDKSLITSGGSRVRSSKVPRRAREELATTIEVHATSCPSIQVRNVPRSPIRYLGDESTAMSPGIASQGDLDSCHPSHLTTEGLAAITRSRLRTQVSNAARSCSRRSLVPNRLRLDCTKYFALSFFPSLFNASASVAMLSPVPSPVSSKNPVNFRN